MVFNADYGDTIGGRIDASTFAGNTAAAAAGGFWLLGLTDQLTVTNSTVTGNSARTYGGGDRQLPGWGRTAGHSQLDDRGQPRGGLRRWG